jgi:hypothetical protein
MGTSNDLLDYPLSFLATYGDLKYRLVYGENPPPAVARLEVRDREYWSYNNPITGATYVDEFIQKNGIHPADAQAAREEWKSSSLVYKQAVQNGGGA